MRYMLHLIIRGPLWAVWARRSGSVVCPNPQAVENPALLKTLCPIIPTINGAITPRSMGAWANNRNYLDNWAMAINQQGTATITGGTTSTTALQFAATAGSSTPTSLQA
jgi:hypothetical protein